MSRRTSRASCGAALALLCALAGTARADDDAASVARGLADGRVTPADAAAAWRRLKTEPDEALELVRGLPLETAPATSHSTTLTGPGGATTDALVILPKDGPDERGRFAVLVLLHGIGGDAKQCVPFADLFAPPHTICVAPSATLPPNSEDPEDLRRASTYGVDVMKSFKHWWSYRETAWPLLALDYVQRRYRVDTNKVRIMGYSMGGFGTWNIGLRYHDRFACMAPMAGACSREEMYPLLGKDPLTRLLLDNAAAIPLFVLHGDEDEVVGVQSDRWSDEQLRPKKLPDYTYHEVKGGKHILLSFLKVTDPIVLRFRDWVATRTRDAHPKRVVHRALATYHGSAFWVRIDELRGDSGKVVAELAGKNQLQITTEGVSKLTLFLDPEVVDPKKRLQVAIDGRMAFKDTVKASHQAVAESFARTHDPQLTYAHMVTLDVPPPGGSR